MPLDPMIAGGIQPIQTGVMSPMQGLQLRQLALGNQMTQADFADQQLARENRVKLRDVFNQPGAFDDETGAPTPKMIQAAGAIDPMFAMNMAREGHLTRQAAIREQNLQQLQDLREAQADQKRSQSEKLRIENMHSASRDFTTAALSRYQALVDQGAAPDAAGEGWRQAWLDEIDQREKSGALKAAGYSDAEIERLKANVPTPDQATQAMQTSREREIAAKAKADNPIMQTRLAQTDRRLDQADKRLEQADAKAQTREGSSPTLSGVTQEKSYLRGDEFLATLKPEYADRIKAIASGRFDIKDFASSRKEQAQLADDVLQYKGDYTKPPPRAAGGAGTLSEKAVRTLAEARAAGDVSVTQNLSKTDKARVMNEAANISGGKDLAASRQSYTGGLAASRAVGTRGVNIDLAAEELRNFADMGIKASEAVPRTNYVAVNKLLRLGREQWSPEQAAFEASNRSIINAFAQVAARSGNATVHNTQEAEHMLNTAQTHQQYVAVIRQLQNEANQAIKATKTVKGALREETSGRKEAPEQAAPAAPAAPAAQPANTAPLSDAEQQRLKYLRQKHGR